MGITLENTSSKYGQVFLAIAFLIVVLSDVSDAQRKIDCRKFVFAPPCRGIAAKRDTHSHSNDIRLPPAEDNDYPMDQRISANDNFANINGLLGILKRAMSKTPDYDPSSNY